MTCKKCEICEIDLKDNAEQSQHYNKSHRGASYTSLYTDLVVCENEPKKSDKGEPVLGKVDKPIRVRN